MTPAPASLLALLVLRAAGDAQDPGPQGTRPPRPAEQVLADYAQAIGGERAWLRHRSVRLRREIEAVGMQIRGSEERRVTTAGRALTLTSLPGIGTFRQGSDGRIRWSEDPINGLRVLSGAEDEQARIENTWTGEIRLKALYKEVRSVAAPVGKDQECVELVPELARPAIACFDPKTHLRVSQQGVHATPQGDVPYSLSFGDWREVDGVKLPFVEEMTAGPATLRARTVEVVFDDKTDRELGNLPMGKAPKPK